MSEFETLRIHIYGVQGSGSIFPSRAEREAMRLQSDLHLLEQVFDDLAKSGTGDPKSAVERILGGPVSKKSIERYRESLPLLQLRVYGGWTSCFRIETSDGHDIVLDCGSGFRICAEDIVAKWGDADDRDLYIFGSHAHYDHTEGFDQAAVCFDPRNRIHILANRQYLAALDLNLGIFSKQAKMDLKGIQTPLSYELMPAQFDSCEIRNFADSPPPAEGDPMVGRYHNVAEPIVIGATTVQPFEVFHPDPCLGFRIEHKGKVFVYCTDHELRRGSDPDHPLQKASHDAEERLCKMAQGADLLYRDGQFLQAEYDGTQGIGSEYGVSRLDWGHSCIEDVVAMADRCEVKRTLIGHHDPNRTWTERNWIDEILERMSMQMQRQFELATAETVIDL